MAQKAFCLTLFYTGCRISEALNLTTGHIDQSEKCIVFETLKRRQRGFFRAVPVPENLVALLAEVQVVNDPFARIWHFSRTTAYRMVKSYMAQAGISGVMACPKGLRHGFGVACIGKSIPLPAIQKWMGHARMETTAIYLNVSGDEERTLAKRLWISC
jgi:integrase